MAMNCQACEKAAKSWTCGDMRPDCEGCRVREIAKSPRRMREQAYTDALNKEGEEAKERLRLAVLAEYRRIDELRSRQ
jgi:DNA-binding cell septation regulator SpoVG